jgi:hypothetical protein
MLTDLRRPRSRATAAAVVLGTVAVLVAAVAALTLLGRGGDAGRSGPVVHVTPATLGSAFSHARPGDTFLLATGDYGTFHGGERSGTVRLTAAPGARPHLTLDLSPAAGLRVDHVEVAALTIAGASHDLTVADSTFTGPATIHTDQMNRADVTLARNRHVDIDKCADCFEGRITLPGRNESHPSGVTIRDSLFSGGNTDGIQNGSNGTRILNNEFTDIIESKGIHTDAIQLYGSKNTEIRGNWIHGTSDGIMAPDGADHETIADNVIDPGSYPYAIAIGSDDGSTIAHNTLPGGRCAWGVGCGVISLGSKDGKPTGRDTIVVGNVAGEVSTQNGATVAVQRDNLLARAPGPDDRTGTVRFVGGARPAAYAGFALKGGSEGIRAQVR